MVSYLIMPPMHPVLTYTLLALCGLLLLLGLVADDLPALGRKRRLWGTLLTVGSLAGAYAVMAPGFGVDGRQALRESMSARKLLFMDFFSPT